MVVCVKVWHEYNRKLSYGMINQYASFNNDDLSSNFKLKFRKFHILRFRGEEPCQYIVPFTNVKSINSNLNINCVGHPRVSLYRFQRLMDSHV